MVFDGQRVGAQGYNVEGVAAQEQLSIIYFPAGIGVCFGFHVGGDDATLFDNKIARDAGPAPHERGEVYDLCGYGAIGGGGGHT